MNSEHKGDKHSTADRPIRQPSTIINQLERGPQIQAILEESNRWLKLESVQKKLARRWANIFKGRSEPFSL